MTEKEFIKKYHLDKCSLKFKNRPNMELMTMAFMDYRRKVKKSKKEETVN